MVNLMFMCIIQASDSNPRFFVTECFAKRLYGIFPRAHKPVGYVLWYVLYETSFNHRQIALTSKFCSVQDCEIFFIHVL